MNTLLFIAILCRQFDKATISNKVTYSANLSIAFKFNAIIKIQTFMYVNLNNTSC